MEPNLNNKLKCDIHFYNPSKENKMNSSFNSFLLIFFMGIFILLGNALLLKFGGISASSNQIIQYARKINLIAQLFVEPKKMQLVIRKNNFSAVLEKHTLDLNKKGAQNLHNLLQKSKIKSPELNMLLVAVEQDVSLDKISLVLGELNRSTFKNQQVPLKLLFLSKESTTSLSESKKGKSH